jgi:DNA-directed RNA polymerase specialized sigma24 family protein
MTAQRSKAAQPSGGPHRGSSSWIAAYPELRRAAEFHAHIHFQPFRKKEEWCEEQDYTQEFLLYLWERWPQYDPRRSSVATWAGRLLTNLRNSMGRRAMAFRRSSGLTLTFVTLEDYDGALLPPPDSHYPKLRTEFWKDFEKGLRSLPEQSRNNIRLLAWHGPVEVSHRAGIPRPSLYRLIQEARCLLKVVGISGNYFQRRGRRR